VIEREFSIFDLQIMHGTDLTLITLLLLPKVVLIEDVESVDHPVVLLGAVLGLVISQLSAKLPVILPETISSLHLLLPRIVSLEPCCLSLEKVHEDVHLQAMGPTLHGVEELPIGPGCGLDLGGVLLNSLIKQVRDRSSDRLQHFCDHSLQPPSSPLSQETNIDRDFVGQFQLGQDGFHFFTPVFMSQ
jgi:hypothetical protein